MKRLVVLSILVVLLLLGCHTMFHPEMLYMGMSRDELISVEGPPDKINTTTTGDTVSEQFIYDRAIYIFYVYVDNGKVTAWQEQEENLFE